MTKLIKNPPRILIAATQSGSGKTTITCGILRALTKRGLAVQGYKTGPDYIDPGYLSMASRRPVHNLDTWLLDVETMKSLFAQHAELADITVVEGVMGLYDGGRGGISSTASIAKLLKIPVILVINIASMAESAAAIALGFREYDRELPFAGVILNNAGSERHGQMVVEAMEKLGIKVFGIIPRKKELGISERHLGLLPTEENSNEEQIEIMGHTVEEHLDLDAMIELASHTAEIETEAQTEEGEKRVRIAIAKDKAFSFYYQESLREAEKAGAEIVFFSPLEDSELPEADGLLLGGGFPEMFAEQLAANESMKKSIRDAVSGGMPVIAECGGYMYLTRSIKDFEGNEHEMCGIIPAVSYMTEKLRRMGYVTAQALTESVLAEKGAVMNGHEFHFSAITPDNEETFPYAYEFAGNCGAGKKYMAGYTKDSVTASYLHIHFAGNREELKRFIKKCEEYKNR